MLVLQTSWLVGRLLTLFQCHVNPRPSATMLLIKNMHMSDVFPACGKPSDFHKLCFLGINNELRRMILPPPWAGSYSQVANPVSGKRLCCVWYRCPNTASIFSLKKHDLKVNCDPGGDGQ